MIPSASIRIYLSASSHYHCLPIFSDAYVTPTSPSDCQQFYSTGYSTVSIGLSSNTTKSAMRWVYGWTDDNIAYCICNNRPWSTLAWRLFLTKHSDHAHILNCTTYLHELPPLSASTTDPISTDSTDYKSNTFSMFRFYISLSVPN